MTYYKLANALSSGRNTQSHHDPLNHTVDSATERTIISQLLNKPSVGDQTSNIYVYIHNYTHTHILYSFILTLHSSTKYSFKYRVAFCAHEHHFRMSAFQVCRHAPVVQSHQRTYRRASYTESHFLRSR